MNKINLSKQFVLFVAGIILVFAGIMIVILPKCLNNIIPASIPTPTSTVKPKELKLVFVGQYSYQSHSYLRNIYVTDKYAYFGEGTNSCFILDVSDKTNPFFLGKEVLSVDANPTVGIYALNNRLYTAGTQCIEVFDITNPSDIKRMEALGYCPSDEQESLQSMIGYGNYLFVWGRTKLLIFDISNPEKLSLVGTMIKPHLYSDNMYVSASRLYVVGAGFAVVDVSDKTHPVLVAKDESDVGLGNYIFGSGNIVYITNSFYKGILKDVLLIFDVSDPKNITLLKTFDREYFSINSYGDKYLFARHKDGFSFFDISDPKNPVLIKDIPANFSIGAIQGNYIYSIPDNKANPDNSILKIYEIKYE